MNAETGEWVAKADGDFHDAQRGIRARKHPNYDGVCFNSQQCVEKYLKACLVEADIRFPKTHDLAKLLDLARALEPSWELWRPNLEMLSSFAVEFRYPGRSANQEEARHAFALCRSFRASLRKYLGLRNGEPGVKRRRKK